MLFRSPGQRIFILTGAGISAESGIRTFRDANGLWEEHRVEDVASPEGFERDPALVWRFYGLRRAQALTVTPNPAHRALADLERALGGPASGRLYLCTQNVDALHEAGGSQAVVHMHGELFRTKCSDPQCATLPFHDERHDFTPRYRQRNVLQHASRAAACRDPDELNGDVRAQGRPTTRGKDTGVWRSRSRCRRAGR